MLFRSITVAYGERIDVSEYAGQEKDPVVLRALTNRIMEALQALSGQEYVDIYATKARHQSPETSTSEDPGRAERVADADEDDSE